jgi:hypothetical protein
MPAEASEFALAGRDAVAMLDGKHAEVAVTGTAGSCRRHSEIHDVIDVIVMDDDLNFELE